TQIRALAGEEAFWASLRGVLEEHRFGVVGTDELLAAFAPALGPDAAARVKRAVDAKASPKLEVKASASGGAVITLRDPEGTVVAPLEVAWRHADGTASKEALVLDQPLSLTRKADGDFLVLDPRDIHPDLRLFIVDQESLDAFDAIVAPLRAPSSAAAAAPFASLAG